MNTYFVAAHTERLEQFIDSFTSHNGRTRLLAEAERGDVNWQVFAAMLFNDSDAALKLADWMMQEESLREDAESIILARELRAVGLQHRRLGYRALRHRVNVGCVRASFQRIVEVGSNVCNSLSPTLTAGLEIVAYGC